MHALTLHEPREAQLHSFLTSSSNYVSSQLYVPTLQLDEISLDYLQKGIKIKISFSPMHALKLHEAREAQLHSFLTSSSNYVSS